MQLISKGVVRQACDLCHRVNVKFKSRGHGVKDSICTDCRWEAWKAEVRYRRESNRMDGSDFYKITRVRRRKA
jgi:hypothetical protein